MNYWLAWSLQVGSELLAAIERACSLQTHLICNDAILSRFRPRSDALALFNLAPPPQRPPRLHEFLNQPWRRQL